MLTQNNPYIHFLQTFQNEPSHDTILELCENTSIGEIAAIIYANNTVNIHPRSITIWHHTDT
ncbi:4472_t:CDS:1, partial [Gigaspora margarita]